MKLKQLFTFAAACSLALSVSAQERVRYTGTELSDPACRGLEVQRLIQAF